MAEIPFDSLAFSHVKLQPVKYVPGQLFMPYCDLCDYACCTNNILVRKNEAGVDVWTMALRVADSCLACNLHKLLCHQTHSG
jgi:hypothetical protein